MFFLWSARSSFVVVPIRMTNVHKIRLIFSKRTARHGPSEAGCGCPPDLSAGGDRSETTRTASDANNAIFQDLALGGLLC